MHKILLILFVVVLVSVPAVAQAEWYVGAGGGVQIARDTEVKSSLNQDVEFDTGWGALGAVGYRYGNGMRTELEFSYRGADVDGVSLSAVDGGSARVYSLMANAFYDVPTGMNFTPYIGVGAGYAHLNYDNVRTIGGSFMDDSDNSPAIQGILGFSVPLYKDVDFFTQYQYQHIFNVDLTTNSGLSAESDYASSLIMAGLRWNFGAPETRMRPLVPVAPAPAAAPAKILPPAEVQEKPVPEIEKYMVFFDFNRTDITIEAADILKKVAEKVKAGKAMRLELSGHADRAGSDVYNDRLSERRVEAVSRYLIRLGLPAADIMTVAKGEHEPLVDTKDGERERQNRRVEILYGK